MFTMLEPNTFPSETPTLSGFTTAKTDTLSSGSEVEKPTRMKPMVVFPKPVMSEILTAFLIVNSLPKTKKASEASRIPTFPSMPSASNMSLHLSFFFLNALKNVSESCIMSSDKQ